jgi:hypothetical protein
MTTFEVYINTQPHVRMGIPSDGVLSAIVHMVRKNDIEEIAIDLAGLEQPAGGNKNECAWESVKLREGDEIKIRIIAASTYDPPISQKPG